MSNKVDGNQPKNKNYGNDVPEDDYDYDTDYDSGEVPEGEGVAGHDQDYSSGKTKNYGGPQGSQGYGQGYGSPGSPAPGGSFPEGNGDANSQILQGLMQDYPSASYEQMSSLYYAQTGQTLSYEEFMYMKQGMNSFDGPYPTKYKGYGEYSQPLSKSYGGGTDLTKFFEDQQMMNDAKEMARSSKKQAHEEKIKVNLILMRILMGDVVGALQAYAHLKNKSMQMYARKVVEKLYAIGKARTGVVRKFAMDKPPRAYGGKDPGQAARAQDKAQDYTKRVQFYTQLMNEYQNTEREMMDAMQTSFRDTENFWQSYSSFRDEKFRTDDKVLTWR